MKGRFQSGPSPITSFLIVILWNVVCYLHIMTEDDKTARFYASDAQILKVLLQCSSLTEFEDACFLPYISLSSFKRLRLYTLKMKLRSGIWLFVLSAMLIMHLAAVGQAWNLHTNCKPTWASFKDNFLRVRPTRGGESWAQSFVGSPSRGHGKHYLRQWHRG